MQLPTHIAFIIDGNRRWAKRRGFSPFEGHRRGIGIVKRVAKWCVGRGISFVTFYVFSTENWKRSQEEVDYLMNRVFGENLFKIDLEYFHKHNMKIVVSGRRNKIPRELLRTLDGAITRTRNNKKGVINFAFNYGGRAEIMDALKRIIHKKLAAHSMSEDTIRRYLYHPAIPDPDLIVRTGGEMRLSNFLIWQAAYSELRFLKKCWPDFNEKDLDRILEEYSRRERRFGG